MEKPSSSSLTAPSYARVLPTAPLQRIFDNLPDDIVKTFSPEQVEALNNALGARGGRVHSLDLRPTMRIPLLPWSFYVVLLVGRNRRDMSEREKKAAALVLLYSIFLFLSISVLLGLLVLYLVKSALGINLFPNFSLGIWDWFVENFLR
ncbi:hypothetical protein [Marinibactrum halimedae]|uniref:3-phosphoshikimate 1-carboxyvinyltransferase n=1 Tax=Marinibactrum halimedae TaxID=1444977 RepID=A0AA37WLQ8_9GAMM|nr:hypothetical protein [Marinibactrum halimedae]MCD9460456.1 hypothetical protein [Marinibactrum halimedae]GLS25863.1 hypothetical protein GCM10007877_15770 [Marinibactrum halimedae]